MKRLCSLLIFWLKLCVFGVVSPGEALFRAGRCVECPSCQWRSYGSTAIIGWCGRPMARSQGVCGCPVLRVSKDRVPSVLLEPTVEMRRIKARGLALPFRKTLLKKQRCPSGRW